MLKALKGDIMENKTEERLPRFTENPAFQTTLTIVVIAQVVAIVLGFIANIAIGLAMLVLFVVSAWLIRKLGSQVFLNINQYILNLSYRVKRGEQEALIKMPIGIILFNNEEEVEWINPYMLTEISDEDDVLGEKLSDVNPDLAEELLNDNEQDTFTIEWNQKVYQVFRQEDINAFYMMDVSDYAYMQEEYEENRPVIGYLFLDNYDELTQGLDDRGVSNFDNFLTTYFSNWGKQHNIFYKRLSDDRYFLLMNYKELENLESDRFSFIDNIRERTLKRNMPLTISIGLSYGEATFDKLSEVAQDSLDLALGRGGDQAIVRPYDGEARYYGGKTNPMEKRTRVRSRMISQSLSDLMKKSEQIFVMGHQYPDMDAIGSSLGIRRIAQMLQKECWVVIDRDDLSNDVNKLVNTAEKDNQISRYIITPQAAEEMVTSNSLVVMVDHHKPSMSIAPELLEKTNKTVIVDHHRRGEEFPENPMLIYIEPYASSTAELITEMFEYIYNEEEPIAKIEATALLGGIVVDTNNFSLRTGSRTFNAASYLQSVGADSALIQELLKEDPDVYLQRSQLIETMEYVAPGYAVAAGEDDVIYSPVVTAQTADTMLSLSGVDASFVITRRSNEKIGISARSLGKVNVQFLMEKLGGGGHLSNAATQIAGKSVQEVKEQLIAAIEEENEK